MKDFILGFIAPWFIWFHVTATLSIMCWTLGLYKIEFNRKPKGTKETLEALWICLKLTWVFPIQFVKEKVLNKKG